MKKYIIILASVFAVAVMGVAGVAIANSAASQEYFATSGYVIDANTSEKVSFTEQTAFSASSTGSVQFQSSTGGSATLSDDSFVHLDDGSVMALSDGVLLDFEDLSSNFINNYYTTRTLSIAESGTSFVAETESGTITFGEHLWKLSDDKYIIRSSSVSVHFSDDDVRDAGSYVEVYVTSDGIVQISSESDTWMTISESCYIQTAGGVTINPVTKVIDDGNYQITINNLVISADDSIVLTEDETRRQIVPEINIEAIDGEDGADGESGAEGTNGDSGISGTEGEIGEDGIDGTTGDGGDGGDSGSNGAKGVDSTLSSSTNTSLPSMSIGEWIVTSTSLQGTIVIGESGVEGLTDMAGVVNSAGEEYYGTITITNATTGEVVYCYYLDDPYEYDASNAADDGWKITEFSNGVDFSFTTMDDDVLSTGTGIASDDDINVLEPDTEYKFSVVAYYMINDTIYSREFISRTFYTDSTGVQVSLVSTTLSNTSTPTSTTANASISASVTDACTVTLYLLTAAQNTNVTLTSLESGTYTQTSGVQSIASDGTYTWDLTGLATDTQYVVRSVVTIDGVTSLTSQEVEVYTLKRQPDYTSASVSAYYNRVNGLAEVFVSGVTDYDDGITQYVYTVYDYNDTTVPVTTKTVDASQGDDTTFYLSNGTYYVTVTAYFDDNEKVTILDLGKSNTITIEGSTLPTVSWSDDTALEYDSINGTIVITMDGTSYMTVGDNGKFVTLDIYADQVMDTSVTLNENDINADGTTYSVTATSSDVTGNYEVVKIDIDLENLLQNTNYSFTVSGYIDLGDGNGVQYRTLGALTTSTYAMNTGVVSYVQSDSSFAVAMMMSININDSDGSSDEYVAEQIVGDDANTGAVTVKLYSGSGATTSLLGSVTYAEEDDLYKIFGVGEGGTGVEITEESFDLSSLSTDATYTLEVSYVADDTNSMSNLSYVNEMTLSSKTKIVTAVATPPDLSRSPETAVIATPITNENAGLYGANVDESLPDDTVIGYVVETTYDNSQRLATSVTYYIYEYIEFYNALTTGYDPILGDSSGDNKATTIREITLDVTGQSDDLPTIAVFFEDVTFNYSGGYVDATAQAGGYYYNGSYVYQGATTVNQVFERGYRYLFAYTATYNPNVDSTSTTADSLYPYDHSSYTAYKNYYGSDSETNLGAEVAYVLNSGIVSISKADPSFASYVYATTDSAVTLHYTFNDVDGAIVTSGNDITQISFPDVNGIYQEQAINATELGKDDNDQMWYSIALPYDRARTAEEELVLTPEILIDNYVDDERYDGIWDFIGAEDETFYLAQIPVENDYEALLTVDEGVKVEMDIDKTTNLITFKLVSAVVGDSFTLPTLVDRAYALKVTFTVGSTSVEYYLPITTDTLTEVSSASCSTSLLSDFIDQEFTVTAELYYDNGDQGWSLVKESTDNPNGVFALQRTNNTNGDFTLSSYYTTSGLSSSKSNALSTLGTSYSSIDNFVSALRITGSADEEDSDALLTTTFNYVGSSYTRTRYLTVEQFGVSDTTSNNIENISAYHIVPKGVSVYGLIFDEGEDTGTIDYVTPSVGDISHDTGAADINILSFTVSAYNQIKEETATDTVTSASATGRFVTVTVYESVDGSPGDPVKDADGNVISATVCLGEDGVWTGTMLLDGLQQSTTYFYKFTATLTDGTVITLLNTSTAEVGVYEFTTVDGILITPSTTGVVYTNVSYLEKTLTTSFTLNEYRNVTIQYDIYTLDQIGESASDSGTVYSVNKDAATGLEQAAYLSYAEMVESGILASATAYYSNNMTISLEPSTNRDELVPGETYYLRIYASTGSEEANNLVYNEQFLSFTITAASAPSTLVYAQDATSDSITFLVSVVDAQYSLMNTSDSSYNVPYVVRFTDENGDRIFTTYDNQVFTTNLAKQEFQLIYQVNDEAADDIDCTLAGISKTQHESYLSGTEGVDAVLKADTMYYMYVYSLVDLEHDGLSYPTAMNGTDVDWDTTQTASYFANNYVVSGDSTYNYEWGTLNYFVDTFWASNTGVDNNAMDTIENYYAIGSKLQSTTNEDDFLLAEESVSLTYNSSAKFELILSESYGIVITQEGGGAGFDDIVTQTFSRVEYSIEGYSYSSGLGYTYYGNSYNSLGDELFEQEEDVFGFTIYSYELPQAVESGTYNVTVKLYYSESDPDAAYTFTFAYRG